jgi:TIR domain
MKVFISWSGPISHKVAMILREWLPLVIQSLVPYVSSEDIEKGARWAADIAKELENAAFGIICVTKDNMDAPWLCFEAGALSKTMDKSLVTPFLFNIKRSEIKGPILQFQSTIFEREDIKKLVYTLNKAYGLEAIPEARLEKIFDKLYPDLEKELNNLMTAHAEPEEAKSPETNGAHNADMLEEILELARDNQKLLRNPEHKPDLGLEEIRKMIQDLYLRSEQNSETTVNRTFRRLPPFILENLIRVEVKEEKYFGFLIILSFLKNDFPWVYDLGKELINLLKSNSPKETKETAVREFKEMLELSLGHPIMREFYVSRKDGLGDFREMLFLTIHFLDDIITKFS